MNRAKKGGRERPCIFGRHGSPDAPVQSVNPGLALSWCRTTLSRWTPWTFTPYQAYVSNFITCDVDSWWNVNEFMPKPVPDNQNNSCKAWYKDLLSSQELSKRMAALDWVYITIRPHCAMDNLSLKMYIEHYQPALTRKSSHMFWTLSCYWFLIVNVVYSKYQPIYM